MRKIFGRFKGSSNKDQQPKGPSQFVEQLGYEVREKDLPKLHKAVWNGDLAKVKQLTKKDLNALDKENRTALHLAVVKGHAEIAQVLLEWSARTNLGDDQGKTPLMKAVECNKEDCVRLLLEYKASVDAIDKEGSSSLHYAVREGYTRIVAELINHRADINRKNKQGHTPLLVSVIEKRDEVTRLLLENKADPNITDNNIKPPISYACEDGSITQVKLLLQANADPTIKDASGWLPEDLAESHGHHACSQLIRDHNSKIMRSSSRQPDSTSTTPRTPGSSATTPRTISSNTTTPRAGGGDSGLFGLPSINKEDSEEESTDVMSGPKTDENSWADDTDISQAIDEMKKPDNSSDLNDDLEEERKEKSPAGERAEQNEDKNSTPQPKLSLAVKLSDSESDKENQDDTKPGPRRYYRKAKVMINAEQIRVVNKRIPGTGRSPGASPNPHSITPSPVFSATPSPKPGTPSKSPNPFQVSGLSIEEDNSDDDHGLRKYQHGRVSFREDISEHSITDEDSGEEFVKPKRPRMQEIENERPETTGYSPSALSNNNASNNMSSERIKDLMENLGLESGDEAPDVDSDASFSDDDSEEKFEIPEFSFGSKSDRKHYPVVPDDVTVHSDITTPRPGILKKKDDHKPQTSHHRPQYSDEDSKITVEAEINLTALKSSSPVSPRKDEPSEWDSEAPDSSRQTESKREESEWDSDLEDAVNPDRDTEENLGSYDPHSENATPLTIAEIMDEETDGAEMVGTADESEVEELDTSASKSVQIMSSSTSAERSKIKGSFEEIRVRSSFEESYTLIEDDEKKEGGEEEEEMVQEENEEATVKRRNVNGGDNREFLNKEDNKTPESTPVDEVDLNGVEEFIQQASDLNEVEEFIRQETEGDTMMKIEVIEPHLAPRVILDYEPSTEDTSDVETLPSDHTPLQEEVVNEEVQEGQSVIWRQSNKLGNNQGSKTGSTENLARVLVVEEPSSDRIQYQSAGIGNYQVECDSTGPSQDAIGEYAALMNETSDIDSIYEPATPRTPRDKGAYDLLEDEEVKELEYEDTEEMAEGQEETIHEDVTFFNIPSPYDVNSPFDQIQSGSVETPTPIPQQTVIETDWKKEEVGKNEEEEEEEDSDASSWTSDSEKVGKTHSTLVKRPGYTEVENEGFSPDNQTAPSSDEEESVSEWEIESKQRQKEAEQRQRLLRDEALRKQKEAQENQEAERQRQQQKDVERKRELERQKELERQREAERLREERQRQREWEEEQRIEAERQQEWEEEERKKQEQLTQDAKEALLQEQSMPSDGPDDEDERPSRSFHGTSNRSLLFPKVPELKKPNLLVVKDFVKIPTKTAPNSLTIKQSGEIENESPVPVGEDQIDASHVRYVGSMPPVIQQTGAHDRISVQNEKQTQVVVEKVVSTVHTQNAKGQEVKVQSGVRDVAGAAQENGNMAVNSQQRKSRQLSKPREELNRIEAETKRGPHHDGLLPNGSLRVPLTGPGTMSLRSDGRSEGCSMDDEDSVDDVDSPRTSRPENSLSHLNGLYVNSVNYNSLEPGFDDDGLSVTSTENGDNSLAYRPENLPYGKDMLVNMNLSDPGAVLKLQEHLREHRRQLEHERNQKMLIESKYKSLGKEKNELQKRIDNLGQQKSKLEQEKLDLDAKIRNLEYSLSEEEEKRKNAEVLLGKTKEHLKKKEEAFTSEIESKQRAELTLRNIQMELRTANNQIKELEEEKEVLQRQLSNEKNAVQLQKKINGEQQRLHEQLQQENLRTSSQKDDVENKLEMADDDNKQFQDNVEKLKSENTAFKAEIQRQRARWTDENALLSADNEKLRLKVEDLKAEVKLIEEAMNKASVQHSLQLNSTRSEAAILNDTLQKERASNDKLEAELESIKSRLQSTTSQFQEAEQARGILARKLHESREEWARQVEKKDVEVNTLKETSQNLMSRLNATETKLNTVENELHNSNTTLLERNNQLQQSVRDVQYYKSAQDNFEQNYRHEKMMPQECMMSNQLDHEQTEKLQKKLDSLQEKLSTHQHENLSLKQQLETAQVLADRSGFDLQEKISTIMVSIKASNEKALDEKTYGLNDTISRLREELRLSENRRNTLEQDLWKLNQESNDMIRKLSVAEASLEMASKAKESLEQERQHLKMDMEKLQQRYQSAQDHALECQSQVSGLVERLEKAEQNNILISQHLANTSATMHTKGELEEPYQKLQVESVKLEAELKHEKQRSEMLQRDLQDSQKVRSSLEALCSNLKSTNAHLEEKLGSEHADGFTVTDEKLTRSTVQHQAAESKELWEREVISRSKLGLRMAQLEKQKQETLNQAEEEKRKTRKALEQKRIAEAKFEAEQEKTSQLQKEVANLKNYLKVAKKKLKAHGTRDARVNTINTAFDHERNAMEEMMVAVKAQMEALKQQLESEVDEKERLQDKNLKLQGELKLLKKLEHELKKISQSKIRLEDEFQSYKNQMESTYTEKGTMEVARKELEAQYRLELNRKLDEVNNYLEEQARARQRLDAAREEQYSKLSHEKKRLQEEVTDVRMKYEKAKAEKDTKEMEAKRYRDLYENEMQWRMRLSEQLFKFTDKAFNYKTKFVSERQKNRLYGSMGNLAYTSPVNGHSLDVSRINGSLMEDPLSNKLRAELDRSIAKHLEAAPHELPAVHPDDSVYSPSSFAKSNSEYMEILKRKFCV